MIQELDTAQDLSSNSEIGDPIMIVTRGYKTELSLNNRQTTHCKQHAGTARFVYNWGLHRKISQYQQTRTFPSAIDLHRELTALKKTAFPWMY